MLRSVAVVFALTGCSFALVSGPPANHRQLPVVDCTTARLGPVLDTVWTVLQSLNLVVAATKSEAEWNEMFGDDPALSQQAAIPLYATFAALGAAGMYYGFTRTSGCRRAKAELLERAGAPAGGAPAPGPGTWPPPAPAPAPSPEPDPAPAPEPAPVPAPAPAPSPAERSGA